MNKTKLLLTLAIPVLICQDTQAQSRLTAAADWTHNGAEFIRTDSTSYNYFSTVRGGDLKNQLKFDNASKWTFEGDTLNNNSRWVQEFDAANRLTTRVSQWWDGMISFTWINQFKYIYTYNSAGSLATKITQHWDGTSAWITDSKNVYTYNAANQLSYDQFQVWDGVSSYVAASQITYYYDASGNIINETSNDFISSTPVFTAKVDYTYNSANKMLTANHATWNGAGWDNTEMYTHTYDTSNRRTTSLHQNFDGTAYVNDMLMLFSDFSGSNAMTEIDQMWDTTGMGSWNDTYKFAYTYNGNGQLTSATRQSNDISVGWTNTSGDTKANYYYGAFVSSVKSVSNTGGTVSMFPVPAQNTVNINVNWNTPQTSTVIVSDMAGRVVKTVSVPYGANQFANMSVAELANGNYMVNIVGSTEGRVVKQIVVAH
jgi:hypothetical protein